uniref:Uncharacterized protein n=1 Tax=Leersia perrieri TaxID=77586 RepID=A0A0D9WPB1_9ORYZ
MEGLHLQPPDHCDRFVDLGQAYCILPGRQCDGSVHPDVQEIRNLTAYAQTELMFYHIVAAHYSPKALKTINGELNMLATYGGKILNLSVKDDGVTV